MFGVGINLLCPVFGFFNRLRLDDVDLIFGDVFLGVFLPPKCGDVLLLTFVVRGEIVGGV